MTSFYDESRNPLDYLPHWSEAQCVHGIALSQPCQRCSDELDDFLEELRWGEGDDDDDA